MKRLGLTGGIASGKSLVSQFLRDAGVPVVDADQLSREVVGPSTPALEEIARRFPSVVEAGVLNRSKLAERIFKSPTEREALNSITHPRIRELAQTRLDELEASGATLAVYEVPLLIENGLHNELDGVILVTAPREVQKQRLMQRNKLNDYHADARLNSQLSNDEKRRHATWEIDNSGTPEETKRQVDALLATLAYAPRPK